jgi:hypothetical protein
VTLLIAVLPEFLGSLTATLTLGTCQKATYVLRSRYREPHDRSPQPAA